MIHEFLHNPLAAGTLTVIFTGWLMVAARDVPRRLLRTLRSRLITTMDVRNDSSIYPWVKSLVAQASARARYVEAAVAATPGDTPIGGPPTRPRFVLAPAGLSLFRYRGRRVLCWTSKEAVANGGWRETITLQTLGGRQLFLRLLEDAWDKVYAADGRRVEVWMPTGSDWRLFDRKAPRALDTLIVADHVRRRIFDDVREFLGRREWYRTMGIPYRRGYLLHGPPGNGKSTIAHVLASELGVGINVASLPSFSSDCHLIEVLSRVPAGNVLLLEDVDAAFANRKAESCSLSFSGLLNALDGVAARDGQIVMMTTNHPEKLDPALTRPGRADVTVEIGNAKPAQSAAMFSRFFPESGLADYAEYFAGAVRAAGSVSMAAIQEHLVRHRDDPDAAARFTAERTP